MFRRLLLAIATFALYGPTSAQMNTFSNPPVPGVIHDYSSDHIWHIGTTQNISWATDYDLISLVLWQNGNSSAFVLIDTSAPQQYLEWPVQIDGTFQLSDGNGMSSLGSLTCTNVG